ncbi:MAG: DUF192 domain-containing protein [Betaproteobacteria bacterium]|nr:DUF192 domain-containing protein [Betaproteobacteria bacterium]
MIARRYLILLLLLLPVARAQDSDLPRVNLALGFYNIEVEVAATTEARMQGLMGRKSLGEYSGMLFIFPQAERHCMWMKNTLIPLSVAFLDETGRIINIRDMRPLSEESHCAAAPARFALEMGEGWFGKKGFKAGDSVRFPQGMAHIFRK